MLTGSGRWPRLIFPRCDDEDGVCSLVDVLELASYKLGDVSFARRQRVDAMTDGKGKAWHFRLAADECTL